MGATSVKYQQHCIEIQIVGKKIGDFFYVKYQQHCIEISQCLEILEMYKG